MRTSAFMLSVLAGTGAVTVLTGYFLFFRRPAKKPAKKVKQHQFNFHCSPDRGENGGSSGGVNKGVQVTRHRSPSPAQRGSPRSSLTPFTGIATCYGKQAIGINPAISSSCSSLEDDVTDQRNVSSCTEYSELSNTESSTDRDVPSDEFRSGSSTDVDIESLPRTPGSPLSALRFDEYLNSPIVNSFAGDMRVLHTRHSVQSTDIVAEYDNARSPSVITETYNRIYNTYHDIVPSLEPNTKPMFFNNQSNATG